MSYTTMINREQAAGRPELYELAQEPTVKKEKRNLAGICIDFIRNGCEGLGFEEAPGDKNLNHLRRDVDRLCLENAVHRFVNSGSKDTAFDVYFCFAEIFKPFGEGYQATRVLLETLADHEENSSSLLMKHRDHYSHSVYVFLLGIAIFHKVGAIRRAYCEKYQLSTDPAHRGQVNCDFLKKWGMTALFHDIGYPYEIAHQQIKVFSWQLDERLAGTDMNNPSAPYAPYVSYHNMDQFTRILPEELPLIRQISREMAEEDCQDMDAVFAKAITDRLGNGKPYCFSYEQLWDMLEHRGESQPFMDHAYFSGLILFKRLLTAGCEITPEHMDILTAIMLHNSMFRFDLKKPFPRAYAAEGNADNALQLDDGAPLAYLLMLCDELQCWDRTAYGQNSRREVSPWDFDLFFDQDKICATYYFDEAYYDKALGSKTYNSMIVSDRLSNPAKNKKYGAYKFVRDINEIIHLTVNGEKLLSVNAVFTPKKKMRQLFLSSSDYMNIYDFAVVLNARYDPQIGVKFDNLETATQDRELVEKMEASFAGLSLEFKLSNIAQARTFAHHLEEIGCFYTNRAVDYEVVRDFSEDELEKLSRLEHDRWTQEKQDMGWVYGDAYTRMTAPAFAAAKTPEALASLLAAGCDADSLSAAALPQAASPAPLADDPSPQPACVLTDRQAVKLTRELTRHHIDIVPLEKLSREEILKDTEPMRCMIKLLELYDGLRIYRKDEALEER